MTGLGLRHRPYLLGAAGLGLASGLLAGLWLQPATAALIGWCIGACSHMLLTTAALARATPAQIRERAEALDEGEAAILATSLAAAIAAMGGVIAYLGLESRAPKAPHVLLASVTLLVSWSFVHILFAVHYAHEFWQHGGQGLDFPGERAPDHWDFLYVAFTIGMTFQTSDVGFRDPAFRRLALVHALVSFLFNMVILATAVNLVPSLTRA